MAHILLPTDFSDHSLNACDYALSLFGGAGNRFSLVHAYMDPAPGDATMVDMSSALYSASVEGLALFADRFRKLKGADTAVISTEVVYGLVAPALVDLCKEKSADIIAMGTHGAMDSAFFGSNAGAVAKSSRVPVLIIPKNAHFHGLRHLLLADDHTGVEPLSLRLLVKLAHQHGADIAIAHVLRGETDEPDARVVADYDNLLSHVEHRYIAAAGDDVALTLSNLAERENVDLVAVLHRHMGFLDNLFHGSVAKRLVMHSRVPMLVLEH